MSKHAYVIGKGERGEGQEPVAVTASLDRAKRLVFERFDIEVTKHSAGKWVATDNGIDEVWIHRFVMEVPR